MVRIFAGVVLAVVAGWLAAAPARPADPVMIGSRWVGKLTQKGTFAGGGAGPPEYRTVLTVTGRAGETFSAELKEDTTGLSVTYLVTGEVARLAGGQSYTVSFRSVDAKDVQNTSAILGVPYTGTVAGRSMTGTWTLRSPDQPAPVEGEFVLELAKEPAGAGSGRIERSLGRPLAEPGPR